MHLLQHILHILLFFCHLADVDFWVFKLKLSTGYVQWLWIKNLSYEFFCNHTFVQQEQFLNFWGKTKNLWGISIPVL
jgi:hypothetical protein